MTLESFFFFKCFTELVNYIPAILKYHIAHHPYQSFFSAFYIGIRITSSLTIIWDWSACTRSTHSGKLSLQELPFQPVQTGGSRGLPSPRLQEVLSSPSEGHPTLLWPGWIRGGTPAASFLETEKNSCSVQVKGRLKVDSLHVGGAAWSPCWMIRILSWAILWPALSPFVLAIAAISFAS